MPLDLTTVSGTVYRSDGTAVENPVLHVMRALLDDVLVWRQSVKYTGDGDGVIEFDVPRGSIAYIKAEVEGLDAANGVAIRIPDAATANLEDLLPATTVTVSGVTTGQLAAIQADVDALNAEIDALTADTPSALDTLNELAAAINDDANFAATVTAALSNKQPLDSDLTTIAGLSPSNDDLLQRKGGAWTNRTPAQVKSDLALAKADVGLSNVDNTSDATKNAEAATLTNKTIALGSNAVTGTTAEFNTALTDGNFATLAGAETLTNKTLTAPAINSPTGLVKADVGLSNVDNTSDANKPVSTATQAALDLKSPLASPTFTGTVSGVSKAMVGLANVDNTSDAAKPISAATQTALDGKADTSHTHTLSQISDVTATAAEVNALHNVKRYVALLSQTGTDAPVATVLENTLGGAAVWSRSSEGQYTATLAGAFAANKTVILATNDSGSVSSGYLIGAKRATDNTVTLTTFSDADGALADDAMNGATIEIRVYPA